MSGLQNLLRSTHCSACIFHVGGVESDLQIVPRVRSCDITETLECPGIYDFAVVAPFWPKATGLGLCTEFRILGGAVFLLLNAPVRTARRKRILPAFLCVTP